MLRRLEWDTLKTHVCDGSWSIQAKKWYYSEINAKSPFVKHYRMLCSMPYFRPTGNLRSLLFVGV